MYAVEWTENVPGELVGTVIKGAPEDAVLKEIKNAPIDYPTLDNPKSFTDTIEINGAGKKMLVSIEDTLAHLTESATQVKSCKYKLNQEPKSFFLD